MSNWRYLTVPLDQLAVSGEEGWEAVAVFGEPPTSPLQASRLTSRTHSQTTPVQLERVVAESNRTRRTGEPRHNRTRAQCKGSSREVVSTCNTAGVKLAPGLTFSWKRAIGITAAKRKIARATRIPTSRQGRRAKLGRWFGIK